MALSDLLAQGETANIDLKGPMAFEGDDRLEIAKDIIALANTRDGGTLVIGVSQIEGKSRVDGLTPKQVESFDITKVAAIVHERSAPPVRLHVTVEEHDGKNIVLVQVPEFDDQPIVCTKDCAPSSGKQIFRRGDILIRSAAAQSIRVSTESDMRDLLNRAVQRRANTILSDIAIIMRGASSPRESEEERLQRHWEDTRRFAGNVADAAMKPFLSLGKWKFELWPDQPIQLPTAAYDRLQKALRASAVQLRGWDFPHTGESFVNRQDGETQLQYVTQFKDWHIHSEHTLLVEDGYFRHDQVLWEDLDARSVWGTGGTVAAGSIIDWLGALYTLGELTLFAGRISSELGYEGIINLRVELSNVGSPRELTTRASGRALWRGYTSEQPKIELRKSIQAALLRANPGAEAMDLAKRIFALFGWNDPSEKMLLEDLNRLYTRRL